MVLLSNVILSGIDADRANLWIKPRFVLITLLILLVSFGMASASPGINFNYTNVTNSNYTITDNVLNSENFLRLVGGDIQMPSLTLKFAINKTLISGNKTLDISSLSFGPRTTSIPNQKVYYAGSGGTATVEYTVEASSTYFANAPVNISTFKQASDNIPFFSDFSIAFLNFDDLKNTWNNDSKVLDGLVNTASDENKINETQVTLDVNGKSGTLSQNLAPGNYFIWVTRGVNPKEIITWNIINVMPFNSSVAVGDGSGTAIPGHDLNVSIVLDSSAPAENYTYITSIINRSDYADNLGNININWSSTQTLANATMVNGIPLDTANGLTDIIPRSNTTRATTGLTSAVLTLKVGALPAGSYFVHTAVFNSTNRLVGFNQSPLTLTPMNTIIVPTDANGTVTMTVYLTSPDGNVSIVIPQNTTVTWPNGTAITNFTLGAVSVSSLTGAMATAPTGERFLGVNVNLTPEGARFNPPIRIRFNYTDAMVAGIDESSLEIRFYNTSSGKWDTSGITIVERNLSQNYIVANVSHFSTFALMGAVATQNAVSGGGAGGGGAGGGGAVSSENVTNIDKYESRDANVAIGSVSIKFTTLDIVNDVGFDAKTNEGLVTARAEQLKGRPTVATSDAPGTVYRYFNIWLGTSGYGESSKIENTYVIFNLPDDWVASNNIQSVKLMKFVNNAWVDLKTDKISSNTYKAETSGFSSFAIVGSAVSQTPAPGTLEVTSVPTAVPGTPAVTGAPSVSPVNYGFVIGLIIIIAIVVVVYIKRKEILKK